MIKKIIIGISGASGVIYGIRMLQVLKKIKNLEVHLIISNAAKQTILIESKYSINEVKSFADVNHSIKDITANISSGSFKTLGMIVLPCSIKTLSGIAHSYADNLLIRAADVVLKEKRKLILCVRDTPLHINHLKMMANVAELGAIIMPPVPAFYFHPQNIQQIIDQTINRILDQFNIILSKDLFKRWKNV